jgi:hypothetical protein
MYGQSRKLAAVSGDDGPPEPRPRSVSGAAQQGSRRDLLVAMRARVAEAVDDPDTPPRDLAALTRRLMDIAKEIEMVTLAEEQESESVDATPDETWDDSSI